MDVFTPEEILKARAETPGTDRVTHFNNAGAALMPDVVLNAVIDHLKLEAELGAYEAAEKQKAQVDNVYQACAKLLGADVDEIAVVENATRAWDMAFYSIPFRPGDKILTCKAAYASDYIAFLQVAEKKSLRIEVIPDDENGQVSVAALANMLDEKVRLVSITHVPTNGGLVNPVHEIGKVTRQAGVYYLLDACQSAGQIPLNVAEIGCDMLSGTSRKYLRGPRGMGFLYVKKSRILELQPPFLDLHAATWTALDKYQLRDDAKRFENWETNYAAKIGMGVAIDYAISWGVPRIWQRVRSLGEYFRQSLEKIERVLVCDKGKERCGIVTFMVSGHDPVKIKTAMQQHGINVTTSSIYGTRLDMETRKIDNLVRASVHYYNTQEEIDLFCSILQKYIKLLG